MDQGGSTVIPDLAPYRPRDVGTSRAKLFATCNHAMYWGYGPACVRGVMKWMAYPLVAYERLLIALAAMRHIEPVTLEALCRQPGGDGTVRLAIRHDVDGDIVTARAMAEIEARHAIPTSYYMLHTAAYHGRFVGGTFERHATVGHVYREIQDLGHEIGLHTDPLTVYQEHRSDGAEAVRLEIEWLREQGLQVRGTVAHGSTASFGAESFEIFKGRRRGRLRAPDHASDEPRLLEYAGRPAWLNVLDEDELGLVYEGNEVHFQTAVPVEYGATRLVDGWRWNAALARRRELGSPGPQFCTQEELLRDIASLRPGCCVVLVVHPCYYGLRHAPDAAPIMQRRRITTTVHSGLGWRCYEPLGTQCWADDRAGGHQAIHVANARGQLDVPPPVGSERAAAKHRILLVGGGAMDGREVATPSQFPRLLEAMIEEATGGAAICEKMAFPRMGLSRLWAWLDKLVPELDPTLVVLGLTSQEMRASVPEIWSVEEGFSIDHPPGDYLAWRSGRVEPVRRSSRWRARQRTPRRLETWPGTDMAIADVMGLRGSCRLGAVDCRRYVELCCVSAVRAATSGGARCLLMITEAGESVGWFGAAPLGRAIDDRHSVFVERARSLASVAGATLVDPYEAFADSPEGLPPFHADGSWTPHAHRLAAAVLYAQTGE